MATYITVKITDTTPIEASISGSSLSRPYADVRAYGAVGDGSTDDTSAIQAAVDGLPTSTPNGGTVLFPAGTYLVSSAITTGSLSNIHFRGMGTGATIIRANSAAIDVFCVGPAATPRKNRFSFSDLHIDSDVTKTAGAGINFQNTTWISVHNVFINEMDVGISMNNVSTGFLDKVIIYNDGTSATKKGIYIEDGNDQIIDHTLIYFGATNEGHSGIHVVDTDAMWIDNTDVIGCAKGLALMPTGAGKAIDWSFISNSAFDSGTNGVGIYIEVAASGGLKGIVFTNTWTGSNTKGVHIASSAGYVDGVHFLGHRSISNSEQGVLIADGENITLDNLYCTNNGKSASEAGIEIAANISEFAIRNCRSGQMANQSNTQGYGILVNAGTGDNYIITDNDVRLNITKGILDSANGNNSIVADNLHSDGIDVASTATVTLPSSGDFFNVTGTTNITSVTASWTGRRVSLKFAGILTFTDGSNLKLAGDFVTTADDVITIVCDGTSWFEETRSIN